MSGHVAGGEAKDVEEAHGKARPEGMRRAIGLAVIAGLLAWSSSLSGQTSYTYRSLDGWCLRHSGNDLVFFPDPERPRGVPEFVVPFPLPLPLVSAGPEATGLVVGYTADPSFSTTRPEAHPGRAGCLRVPSEAGLDRLTGEGRPDCSVRESRDWHDTWYEPAAPFAALDGVFIRCGRDEAIVNCQMTGLLPNGWEAQIVLPRAHLAAWSDAAQAARVYFETHLSDCGAE